jgi:glutamate formiminotransferase
VRHKDAYGAQISLLGPGHHGAYDPAPLTTTLLAYPNVSEGRDREAIERIGQAFGPALLDVHSDVDHHRSAYTLAGRPGELAQHVVNGAREAVQAVRVDTHEGVHPRVGAIDVAPIIYLSENDRGAAAAEALVLADMLATELRLPVFLYGLLAGGRTRAELRKGGPSELQRRIEAGELAPDFGPARLHPTAGAVLVAARAPLVAFNLELEPPATLQDARSIAAHIREGGDEGLTGLRAIGLWLAQANLAQVSTNVEDHRATPLRAVVEAVARHAPVKEAELVGLAPEAAFEGWPDEIPLRGYATIEETLHHHAHTA